jgi:hypothetical protein
MRFAYREFVTPGMLVLVLSVSTGLIMLYSFIGPLDTRTTLNWNMRLALCVVTGVLSLLICYPAMALTLFLARQRSNAQMVLALAAFSLVISVPCGAIAYGVYDLFGTPRPPDSLLSICVFCAGNVLGSTLLFYYVLFLRVTRRQLLAGSVVAARQDAPGPGSACMEHGPVSGTKAGDAASPPEEPFPARDDAAPPSANAAPASRAAGAVTAAAEARADRAAKPSAASFLDRLPGHLGHDVVYLKVSGHYLEVVTTQGSGVILQRLMDAVRELGGSGMQVHRSYWVAHRHVRYVVRRDRRTLLHLTGDFEVPVSRTFLPDVRHRIKNAPRRTPVRRRATPRPQQPAR